MIWLLPAALSSIAIAFILKVNEGRAGNRILIAGANYLSASAISFVMLGARIPRPAGATLIVGGAAGVLYVLGFLLLMAGIARLPLAVPVTVSRLSVVLPVAISVMLWREAPGLLQWLGLAVGLGAMAVVGASFAGRNRGERAGARSVLLIAALFVVLGSGDTMLKVFRETGPDVERLAFTWFLFTVAALLTWALVLVRRVPFDGRTFALGLALGVPNLTSTVFTLAALRTVSASIAFPIINLTVIVGSTLLGLLVWRERLGRGSIAGLALAGAAIVLLAIDK